MEDLFHNLGIDPRAIIIQAAGFLIVFLILWKYAFGKVGELLQNRRSEVLERTRKLEDDQSELERLQSEVQKRLEDMEAESRAKMQEIIESAESERDKMIEEARQKAESELERNRREIEREKDTALREIKGTVADLAITAAERILDEELDADRHKKMLDSLIEGIPEDNSQ